MDLAKCRYVVVEGPIGAGKTSLARELSHVMHADPLLEQPEDNPFLARFYEDRARDIGERPQHERALVHARMRQRERRGDEAAASE